MNAPQLTAGAVGQMSNSVVVPTPVVQLIDVKQIQPSGPAGGQTRYRLVLSDGLHMMQAMLATQLNSIMDQGQVRDPSAPRRTRSRGCLLYTSPSPRDRTRSRMPSSA